MCAVIPEFVRLRPEPVASDDLQLVQRVFFSFETLQRPQRAVNRMTIGCRYGACVLVPPSTTMIW